MKRSLAMLIAGAVGVVLGGVLVLLAHSYPKGETALRTYCTQCGTLGSRSHEHTLLGARREGSTRASILTRLLALPPEHHEHAWVEPWAHVFPTYDSRTAPEPNSAAALREVLLEARLRELDLLAETPRSIAVLDAALQNDPARARAFIGRLLDFDRHYPLSAVSVLDRREDWPARWAAAEAFDRAYRCRSEQRSLTCTLTTRGQQKVVLNYAADGRGQVNFPSLRDWSP